LPASFLVSACAGLARGLKTSVYQQGERISILDYSLSKADAMVVILYPAIIHADAEQSYFHAFSINAIGGEVPPANRTKKGNHPHCPVSHCQVQLLRDDPVSRITKRTATGYGSPVTSHHKALFLTGSSNFALPLEGPLV